MRRFHYLFAPLALMLVLNLAACGNKGPLVRPSQAEEAEVDAAVGDETGAGADAADEAGDPEETDVEQDRLDEDGVDPVEVAPPPADPGNG